MICPSCQSPNARRWISCQDRLRNKPLDHHAYYRCLTCGLTFLHPQTTSQSYDQHYDAQYLSHVAERPRVPSDTARRLRLMQERERAWEQNPSFFSRLFRRTGFFRHTPFKMLGHGKRLLDVGVEREHFYSLNNTWVGTSLVLSRVNPWWNKVAAGDWMFDKDSRLLSNGRSRRSMLWSSTKSSNI